MSNIDAASNDSTQIFNATAKLILISHFLDSAYYYANNDASVHNSMASHNGQNETTEQSSRSPMAATRANSLASANSPTDSGSACLKTEALFNSDLNLG